MSRPSSPEECCSICLGEFANEAKIKGCFHRFCFKCIQAWLKKSPTCPLCKGDAHTLHYNFHSKDSFDKWHVNGKPLAMSSSSAHPSRSSQHHSRGFASAERSSDRWGRPVLTSLHHLAPSYGDDARRAIYEQHLRPLPMQQSMYASCIGISQTPSTGFAIIRVSLYLN